MIQCAFPWQFFVSEALSPVRNGLADMSPSGEERTMGDSASGGAMTSASSTPSSLIFKSVLCIRLNGGNAYTLHPDHVWVNASAAVASWHRLRLNHNGSLWFIWEANRSIWGIPQWRNSLLHALLDRLHSVGSGRFLERKSARTLSSIIIGWIGVLLCVATSLQYQLGVLPQIPRPINRSQRQCVL